MGITYPLHSQSTFYGVEMTSERLLNMTIDVLYPQTFILKKNKYDEATPMYSHDVTVNFVDVKNGSSHSCNKRL